MPSCYCEGSEICRECTLRTNPELVYDFPDDSVTVSIELPDNIEVSPVILDIIAELEGSDRGEC